MSYQRRPPSVEQQTRYLLTEFLRERFARVGRSDEIQQEAILTTESVGEPQPQDVEKLSKVGLALRKIGDELDGNYELQRLIDKVSPDDPKSSFLQVAHELFKDGNYNWGRVVALFYFAFKLLTRFVVAIGKIIRDVIEWVVTFIMQRVADWILERGGWESIQEYFGSTYVQIGGVVAAAIVVCAFIYWRNCE